VGEVPTAKGAEAAAAAARGTAGAGLEMARAGAGDEAAGRRPEHWGGMPKSQKAKGGDRGGRGSGRSYGGDRGGEGASNWGKGNGSSGGRGGDDGRSGDHNAAEEAARAMARGGCRTWSWVAGAADAGVAGFAQRAVETSAKNQKPKEQAARPVGWSEMNRSQRKNHKKRYGNRTGIHCPQV